jgi:predicted Zn-dependent protease
MPVTDIHKAIAQQAALVRSRPRDPEAMLTLGLLVYRAGRLAEAGDIAGRVQALAPDFPGGLWLAARVLLDQGKADRACGLLDRITAMTTLTPAQAAQSWLLLGDCRDALGDFAGAWQAALTGKGLQEHEFAQAARAHEPEAARYRRLAAWFAR